MVCAGSNRRNDRWLFGHRSNEYNRNVDKPYEFSSNSYLYSYANLRNLLRNYIYINSNGKSNSSDYFDDKFSL